MISRRSGNRASCPSRVWTSLAWTVIAWLVGLGGAGAGETKLGTHTFTLPDGFEIELVAGPPLIERPITAAYDELGRLYVSESSGTNDNVQLQLANKPHRILRLTDRDGDGRFDERSVYADQLMFPEGTMWLDGSLYVTAPPVIWKLTDTDDDGVADQRKVFFDGKTLTGCANDLHGPYLGRDGWIYWCKGAFAEQRYDRLRGKPLETKAAHIFRCRPDGSGIEPVMTGGMDNPVDVVFTPGGERIFTTTFLVHPGGGLRDGMIHAIYGGVYGKVHGVLDGHPRTGEVMPVLTHLGPAAPCGLLWYESKAFGAEYHNNLFTCSFNMHKVTRHALEPLGATYKTRDEDFLVSDNIDFHPTDVIDDADGSLLVVNTGGWYKLCCPTSQFWKPDILGGIYRIHRRGMPRVEDARGQKLAWTKLEPRELIGHLDDLRLAVQQRAMAELARRGAMALPELEKVLRNPTEAYVDKRRNAVWTLTRIEHGDSQRLVRLALEDPDGTVRHAALHSVSLRRDAQALPSLLKLLEIGTPVQQRTAAEALGRIGDRSVVPALLKRAEDPQFTGDRVREHSLIYALIELGDAMTTRKSLASTVPGVRRAAMIALDQMPTLASVEGAGLDPYEVGPLLQSNEPTLRETASWLVGRHPEWGDALADVMAARLVALPDDAAARLALAAQLAGFAGQPGIQSLLAKTASSGTDPAAIVAMIAMRDSGVKELPAEWMNALLVVLERTSAELGGTAASVVKSVPPRKDDAGRMVQGLVSYSQRHSLAAELRLDALAAVPGGVPAIDESLFLFLLTALDADASVNVRSAAADILSRGKLNSQQLIQLAGVLPTSGPLEVDRLLAAFDQSQDAAVGTALVAALEKSPALANLRADALRTRLMKFGPDVEQSAAKLYAALNIDPAKQKEKLEKLLEQIKDGDVRRGQAVFHSTKTACVACHQMGYLGGNIGPDLTRIADVRSERDLLESIVFPSSSFVRSYEPIVVATKDGQAVAGLIRKEFAEAIVVATGAKTEVRVERNNIDEIRPGNVSVMPSGLDQQLTIQELADLIAFLKAKK